MEAFENENGALSLKIKIPEADISRIKHGQLIPNMTITLQKSKSYTPATTSHNSRKRIGG